MGNGPAYHVPYHQFKKAIDLSQSVADEVPDTILKSLGWSVRNMLVGPTDSLYKEKAGNPGEGLDSKNVAVGIIPALAQAKNERLPGAERAQQFVEHARDVMAEALSTGDSNDIRRAADVVSHLLEAALGIFP